MAEAELPIWMRLDPDPATIEDVVTRINRVRPRAQKKLAKDSVTIAYLDAGRRVIERNFDGEVGSQSGNAFLDWLTREMIFAEYERGPDPLPRIPSDGTFRDRWRSKSDYLADLIAYLNWNRHWDLNRRLAKKATTDVLDPNRPLAEFADEVAYEDLRLLTTETQYATTYRTQMALQPLASGNADLRAAVAKNYEETLAIWSEVYRRLFDVRGLALRPDVSIKDFAIILMAVAEGLAVRAMVEGTDNIMDHGSRTSLLGTAAMAILSAFVDQGDHQTIRELVNCLGRNFPPNPA